MTVKITTELTCNGCGIGVSFVGKIQEGSFRRDYPKHWHKIEPNYEQSVWWTTDFPVSGDFCSLECMIKYLQDKVKERDNPKPFSGIFTLKEEGIQY